MFFKIQKIVERWYITEPAFFQIYVTHNLEECKFMSCPFRCGKGNIQYNPDILSKLTNIEIQSYLKAEIIRILLKHPYGRQPDGCKRKSMSVGSNLVLADNYDFDSIGLPKPSKYGLKSNESYEWYSYRIEEYGVDSNDHNNSQTAISNNDEESNKSVIDTSEDGSKDSTDSESVTTTHSLKLDEFIEIQLPDGSFMSIPNPNKSSQILSNESFQSNSQTDNNESDSSEDDLSSLWDEDSVIACTIDIAIDEINSSPNGWGSLAGKMADTILANTKAKVDYRKVLAGFRSSILSSKRNLTRMRPNRRSGFENMGSIRRFSTNLLVAIDVSGSVQTSTLRHFYSIINKAFKYGIESISSVQFDTELKEVVSFKEAQKEIKILGRGGTNFQPLFNYVSKHSEFDGVIIFTDGDASVPKIPKGFRTKIAWVCHTEEAFNRHKQWMRKIGRCCFMNI